MAKSGKTAKRPSKEALDTGRTRKLTKKQAKLKAKKEAQKRAPIIGSFKLTVRVFGVLAKFWKPLAGVVLVYLLLNIVFASGVSNLSTAVDTIKGNLQSTNGSFSTAINGFTKLVGSAGSSGSATASVLQSVLIVLESLVIIWALRQLLAGKAIRIKQAYYSATAPLVQFLLVILVIILQLLPITLGAGAFELVLNSVITNASALTVVFGFIFGLLAAWSFYMVSGSIFALYIVTLPDMDPRRALRSAKNLVRFRRWPIMRRLLFLPIFVLAAMGLIVVPFILWATFLVAPIFYALSMVAILFVHTYLYSLYRSLLS